MPPDGGVRDESQSKPTATAPTPSYKKPMRTQRFVPVLRYGANKYESEDFRSQRMQKMEAYNQQRNVMLNQRNEHQKQLADLTAQLNHLVSQLALQPKDAPEREDLNRQIQDIRFNMKQLQMSKDVKPNKLDNRKTKLLFKELPDCAKGPGKLAEWIAGNSLILQPKQIAMLATTGDGAVIQYKSHDTADMVCF
ncbi:uncharacterized protein BXIN_0200 [Babesia sp. Xinjiang]|uniref:uncharacterized protein n=1 Tax=Babesia sp. Xinjiang TaxID=462227 RepID=UPI000A23AAA3|nr:uncharacterized protein BXIN_0200 [Babesia sp. Xinjiang]ORM39795.1 hypothetical protein BXIN_0200 [Babesia sp. Xinjiang]